MPQPVTLLVGTTKGAFLLDSDAGRVNWAVRGPFCDGWSINHVVADPDTGTLWAAGGGEWHGAGVWRSQDGGATWTVSKLANGKAEDFIAANPDFAAQYGMVASPPAPFQGQIDTLWSLARVGNTVFTGSKPAALYASADDGVTWEKVQSLSDHPSADGWEPGGAGLTLHTIVSNPDDPARIWLGISAAGVFATEDGGKSWQRRNERSNADVAGHGDCGHDVGYCVHNMVRAPRAGGDLLYQQNHHGVFRSRDGGRSWTEISRGLPSNFGFPVAVHPRDPDRLWVLPLSETGRFPPDHAAAVWASDDGGDTWTASRDGLPGRDCFFTVLRQAMATDRCEPAGIYFGTNSGSIFACTDDGKSWSEIARHLPTVLSVETLQRP